MCCTLNGPLIAAVAQTLRATRPHRLLIEPSGLGHPGGLIDALRSEHLAPALDLASVICCVDLSFTSAVAVGQGQEGLAWDPARLERNDLMRDQVAAADILVGTKRDVAAEGAAERFLQWAAEELFPRKHRVEVRYGRREAEKHKIVTIRFLTRLLKSSSNTGGHDIRVP